MARRLFDVVCAVLALIVFAPILAVAALGIVLSSPGPVLFTARRAGLRGREFTMYKLRTMRRKSSGARITGLKDPRIFPFGRLLRRLKIDELPQLLNVIKGDMAIVGPRPEEPSFVINHYAPEHRETLAVRPGLASPGSLFSTTHGERLLTGANPEARYLDLLLPIKLALDLVYVRRASLRYDLEIIGRTITVIGGTIVGRRRFADPPELAAADQFKVAIRQASPRRAAGGTPHRAIVFTDTRARG